MFGSPVQRSKNEAESFWHVPVTLRRRWKIGPGDLPGCIAYLDSYEKDSVAVRIRLCWNGAVFSKAGERGNLTIHETLLVPIAWRQEGDDLNGYITDTRHILKNESPYPVPSDRKKLRFKLRVKSGKIEQAS